MTTPYVQIYNQLPTLNAWHAVNIGQPESEVWEAMLPKRGRNIIKLRQRLERAESLSNGVAVPGWRCFLVGPEGMREDGVKVDWEGV